MQTSILVTALFGAGVLMAANAGSIPAVSSGPTADLGQLEKRIDQWLDGYNKADVAQMMDVFGADFTMDMEGAPGPLDKAETIHVYDGVFARYETHIEGVTDELRVSGDMAFDRGHYVQTLTPKAGGATVVHRGHFMEVWERQGGVWRVQRLMDMSDVTP